MDEANPVAELLERCRRGDSAASAQLFARYAQRLTRLADQHLSRKLASRVEGEDVVQSVFRTFFRRVGAGEFHFDGSGQIWQLLVKITLCKARAQGRFHTAGRRAVSAEAAGDAWLLEAGAADPGPDEAAILVDQIDALLQGLPAVHGQILQLRLEGWNVSDIARHLDVARQTVHRALNLLQERLERQFG